VLYFCTLARFQVVIIASPERESYISCNIKDVNYWTFGKLIWQNGENEQQECYNSKYSIGETTPNSSIMEMFNTLEKIESLLQMHHFTPIGLSRQYEAQQELPGKLIYKLMFLQLMSFFRGGLKPRLAGEMSVAIRMHPAPPVPYSNCSKRMHSGFKDPLAIRSLIFTRQWWMQWITPEFSWGIFPLPRWTTFRTSLLLPVRKFPGVRWLHHFGWSFWPQWGECGSIQASSLTRFGCTIPLDRESESSGNSVRAPDSRSLLE